MKYILTQENWDKIMAVFLGSPFKIAEPYIEMMRNLEKILDENVKDKKEDDSAYGK